MSIQSDTPTNSNPTSPSAEHTETTTSISHPITPAEYIYSSMIPPSKSTTETAEVNLLGKRERCNTGGSSSRSIMSMSSSGPIMSMDLFLSPEDVDLHIQSSDFVKDMLDLPDTAATAAAALNAEQLSAAIDAENPSSIQQKKEEDKFCPMIALTAKLERISTGDSIAPLTLNENFRISSRDWVKDFEAESAGMGAMHPSLFMNNSSRNFMDNSSRNFAAPSPIPLSNSLAAISYQEYQIPIQSSVNPQQQPSMPPLSNSSNIMHNLPVITTSSATSVTKDKKSTSPSSSTTSKKRKKKRTIDVTRVIEPTDDDVLFGRGGYTNTHRGNIRFRKKALELRPWYESSTKDEKFNISELLIESVKSEGHRFLEKGKQDGMWHEVIGNGARKKASQALRERIKGGKKNSAHASSVTGAGGGNVNNVGEIIGDLMPADVVGI